MDTDFLTHHQPTATTVLALWYLDYFEKQGVWQKDFAFEKRLRDCQLDGTPASLNRINDLLTQIRRLKPNPDTFFKHANHQAFLFTVAFYCGEMRGRWKKIAPVWYTWQEFTHQFPEFKENYPHCLDYQFIAKMGDDVFFPIQAIVAQLFDEQPEKSLLEMVLGEGFQANPQFRLPETPAHRLDFDMLQALKNTPIEFLPYLQMLPPTSLYGDDLMAQFHHLHTLYNEGHVVWAALVHADQDLLTHGKTHSSRAQVVYDPTGRTPPTELDKYAEIFYQYQQDNPKLPNEENPPLLQALPAEISHMPLMSGSLWVWRAHLPNGMLTLPVFPILVADNVPAIALLPARYWRNTSLYIKWLQQQAEINEQHHADSRTSQETSYAFEQVLRQQPDFWANYHELLAPQIEQLPELGTQPQHHPIVPHEADVHFIHMCKAAAVVSHPRATEQRPSARQIIECAKQIKIHHHSETFDEDVQTYAQFRALNWESLLAEVAQHPYRKSRPLPKVAGIIQREKLGGAHIAKLVDFLQEQRFSHQNTTAMLYLSHLYYSGKLFTQSLYEAEHCLKTAHQLGDYRATKWLAEMLLIAPKRCAALLLNQVERDSAALSQAYEKAKELRHFHYDADEFHAQQLAFLNNPFVQLEQIRQLLYQAAEAGHQTAKTRLHELIQQDRLPENASDSRFSDINQWLMAHFGYQPDDFKLCFDQD